MRTLLLLLTMGLLAACSSTQVESTERTPGVNYTAYRTYNFIDVQARNGAAFDGAVPINDLKQAVAREMERRGYQRADSPELWVNIGVVTEERVQTRQTDFLQDGAPRYLGQRRYRWESREVEVGRYEAGTVTVDVVDAARNERIWQGVATSTLPQNEEKLTGRIDEGITRLFAKYPVPARQ